MNHLSVLRLEDWNTLYPLEDYKQVQAKVKGVSEELIRKVSKAAVEYLIAHDKSDETIMKLVHSKLVKDKNFLSRSNNSHCLTILHLAVIKNREPLVKKLIEAGADPELRDAYGWLPIHHAALVSDKMFQLIAGKSKGDIHKKLTPLMGTCEQLRMYAGLSENSESAKSLKVELESGKPIPFDPTAHLALFGMTTYSDGPIYPPEKLKALWMQKKSTSTSSNIDKLREFQLSLKENPKLLIKKTLQSNDFNKNWGLVADENIPLGAAVGIYGGQHYDIRINGRLPMLLTNNESQYVLCGIDAQTVGNLARFANDGFPNCTVSGSHNNNGLSNQGVLSIIKEEGVIKGEELFWDYGQGEVKLKWNTPYKVPNNMEMRDFIQKHTLKDVEESLMAAQKCIIRMVDEKTSIQYYKACGGIARMQYCFLTPAAILDLWCSGIITAENWSKQMADSQVMTANIPPEHTPQTGLIDRFMLFLKFLEKELLQSQESNNQVKSFLLNQIGKYTMLEVTQLISLIYSWLREDDKEDWKTFSESLLRHYPHIEDRDVNDFSIMKI